ncbi:MAG: Cof-type HAD-IIB family hydrolase [Chitinispirillales bacterium]|jgi:Cof subfamily protein (haloacid dehalogenase superfamily)|nr:Cof-type HAD-IIB family hydrolase [Chitinispirillales bacterium]
MTPKLFAFDLDGTLLDSEKRVRPANAAALREMRGAGAAVALASGRIGAGVRRYVPELGIDPALVVLNGAEVYASSQPGAPRIYYAPLDAPYAEYLTDYGRGKPFALNFYHDDRLYGVRTDKNAAWMDTYYKQTGVGYAFLDDFSALRGVSPSKIIFIGGEADLDEQEEYFHSLWGEGEGGSVYVCRTWGHYLEFMNVKATKGIGLRVLCDEFGIGLSEAAAYGDEENDIPMLSAAGFGAAMKNSPDRVRAAAARVTELTNDEDWVAREWELAKNRGA